MDERVGFKDGGVGLKATIDAWYKPLRAKKKSLPWDGIVFRCGTMVRLDCNETHHKPITSFCEDPELDEFLRHDFPDHRMPMATYSSWKNDNEKDFQWSQQTAYPEQCRKAYGCLMWSSYPLSGGIGGDRIVQPWNLDRETYSMMYQTIFHHLGPCCWTPFLVEHPPKELEAMYPQADPAEEDGIYSRYTHMMQDRRLIGTADKETAELRRLDYMFPKPWAYVDKEMNIHVL